MLLAGKLAKTAQCELIAPNYLGPDCPKGMLPAISPGWGESELIIAIRPKLEGAAVQRHIDQQQRQEQESGRSSMQL